MYKPRFEIEVHSSYSLKLTIYYRDATVDIILFSIPGSLEYQVARLVDKSEKDVSCEDIKNAPLENLEWFKRLNELIAKLFHLS